MDRPIRVFIAGPYTHPNPEQNTENAIDVFDFLFSLGFVPFCPHLSHFIHLRCPRRYEEWCNYDLEWLRLCHCLFRMPGESTGADNEVEFARKNGIPVFNDSKDLIAYYRKG